MNIVVIDYGIGNVRSILNAFYQVGVRPSLSRDKEEILNSDGVLLPGVGSFVQGMKNLEKYGLVDALQQYAQTNKPLLGICLGMQMLFNESEEFERTKGLSIMAGKVIKIPIKNQNKCKLPHVSWNELKPKYISWKETILENIEVSSDMYFVHSYVAVPDDEKQILTITEYGGYEFCSSIKKGNIYGCQFRPEKSAQFGLKIIENFVNKIKENKGE